jgi:hypothetical protein
VLRTWFVLPALVVALQADMSTVTAEPNLEKRSYLAIQHAGMELDAARKAYSDDNMAEFKQRVAEIGDLAELSYKSLQDTGKKARKSPKWFKRAEQGLRKLLRGVDNLEKDVSLEDRPMVESVRKRMQVVHDNLLHDIMTKK